jgi:hypothetical protein
MSTLELAGDTVARGPVAAGAIRASAAGCENGGRRPRRRHGFHGMVDGNDHSACFGDGEIIRKRCCTR